MCKLDSIPPSLQKPDASRRRAEFQGGIYWGTASMALWLLAISIGMPYAQDRRNALGCDSLCQGSMNSARSTLALCGATLLGRLSDASWLEAYGGGRRLCLCLGLGATAVGLWFTHQAQSVTDLWKSLLPQIFQQNTSIIKALFSDYHTMLESSPSDRASSAGLLGLMGGLAMMIGPLVGSSVLRDIHQATLLSMVMLAMAMVCIAFTPTVKASDKLAKGDDDNNKTIKKSSSFWSMLDVPSARSPPAIFLLTCRTLSTLGFHIFSTLSTASMRDRFAFGPAEYGQFFAFIGFCYAISQSLVTKVLFHTCGGDQPAGRKRIFAGAVAVIGIGRYLAFGATHLTAMYAYYAAVVLATGVVSTVFATDTSFVTEPGQAGAFFGLVATLESASGMLGPLLGGALAKIHPTLAPMVATSMLSTVILGLVWFGYEPIVLSRLPVASKKPKTD
jgi:hypothetical protein